MKGGKPLPTATKKLSGTLRPDRTNAREPQLPPPSPAQDAPPPEISGDPVASAEWSRLLPLLKASKVITAGDLSSLIALCQQWSRYLEATRTIATAGMVIDTPSKYPMVNPLVGISNKALANCVKLWTELGLTPSSRSRVATAPPGSFGDDDDEFAEFDKPVRPM